jgi:hypothetical protein
VTGDIEGHVLGKLTGRPVPNAKVVVVSLRYSVGADSTGSYRIAGVPVGSQELRALAPEMAPAPATVLVEAGKIARVDFALEPYKPPARGTVLGKITKDAGTAPLPHAFVATPGVLDPGAVQDGGVRADDNGIFLATGLVPGWQEMRVAALGYQDTPLRAYVVDGQTTLVFLDLTRSKLGAGPTGGAPAAPASAAQAAAAPGPPAVGSADQPAAFAPVRALGDTAGMGAQSPAGLPDSLLVAFEVPARENDPAGSREVLVGLYDRQEREVRSLVSLPLAPGRYLIRWDGRDDAGRPVPPGFYLLRVRAAGEILFEKPVPTPP